MRATSTISALAMAAAVAACGGGPTQQSGTAATAQATTKAAPGHDDQSRCDYKGRSDREVVESSGPGALVPNVRRVFGILGEGDDRRRVLFCREIDTNLDGLKDVVRTYNDKGDAVEEQADTNYDDKIDTWIRFSGGRIAKVDFDRNGDGRPDETRYYVKGKISRVQRDTNYDGKPDVWEVYDSGQLERIGVDLDFDGHVDRWDRDEVAHRAAEEKERKEAEAAEAKQKAEAAAEGGGEQAGAAKAGASKASDKADKKPDGAKKPSK